MSPAALKAAGWTCTRLTAPIDGPPRTIWARGEFHIVIWETEPRTWEFRIRRGSDILIADSTWGCTFSQYMWRTGRLIAVHSVDGRVVLTRLSRYGELPKGAVTFGQWATTAIA